MPTIAATLAKVARRHGLTEFWANEVAGNLACCDEQDVDEPGILSMLERRIEMGMKRPADVPKLAGDLLAAFKRGHVAPEYVASGKSGPKLGGKIRWGMRPDQRVAGSGRA
ncbi:MAG: hypothetical protein HOV80_36510 [Polyangiaceae bacterium]|nr:hypothetical protein [Polyangiaceae bacterium]